MKQKMTGMQGLWEYLMSMKGQRKDWSRSLMPFANGFLWPGKSGAGKVWVILGDWLTSSNLRAARRDRVDDVNAMERIDYAEELSCLWHFALQNTHLLMQAHYSNATDPTSLATHKGLLGRVWDVKKPNYAAVKSLIHHSLIARILHITMWVRTSYFGASVAEDRVYPCKILRIKWICQSSGVYERLKEAINLCCIDCRGGLAGRWDFTPCRRCWWLSRRLWGVSGGARVTCEILLRREGVWGGDLVGPGDGWFCWLSTELISEK